jgi:hypothetical protein
LFKLAFELICDNKGLSALLTKTCSFTIMRTVLVQRYDNEEDILAIEGRGYSDVYRRSSQEDFELVAVVPTLAARTSTVVIAQPTSPQYRPTGTDDAPWPGRPDTYRVRIDVQQVRYTSVERLKSAFQAVGAKWAGAWSIRVLDLDENLFLEPADLVNLELEEESNRLAPGSTGLYEGADTRVLINRYERNPTARKKCLDHYGFSCQVCGFDFKKFYGALAPGYIHVHHLRPLAQIKARYQVDPIKDLRPVCANCHAVLHLQSPPYSIEELQAAINL